MYKYYKRITLYLFLNQYISLNIKKEGFHRYDIHCKCFILIINKNINIKTSGNPDETLHLSKRTRSDVSTEVISNERANSTYILTKRRG